MKIIGMVKEINGSLYLNIPRKFAEIGKVKKGTILEVEFYIINELEE